MGYWENTAYVRTRDIGRIVEALTRLCGEEDYRPIQQPALREPDDRDPMQYGRSDENPLWAVAVIPGPTEWTALKTAPLELLIERSSPGSPMRLARLSRLLGADGFQYNVYDSAEVI